MKTKMKIPANNPLVTKALVNYICAEAGRSGGSARSVDVSGLETMAVITVKTRRTAYKQAEKLLKMLRK